MKYCSTRIAMMVRFFVKVSMSCFALSCSGGCICAFSTDTGLCVLHYPLRHKGVVHSVDFTSSVIVSGSRDATVKVSKVR